MFQRIECPNCGSAHYVEHYVTTTAMAWEPEYKDGVLVNKNPNTFTAYCTCCECNHDFYYTECGDFVQIEHKGPHTSISNDTFYLNDCGAN